MLYYPTPRQYILIKALQLCCHGIDGRNTTGFYSSTVSVFTTRSMKVPRTSTTDNAMTLKLIIKDEGLVLYYVHTQKTRRLTD